MRVIADHLRGATFLAVDGVRPSNKDQGYVMRRLVRRAVRYAFDLGLQRELLPARSSRRSPACTSTDYPEVAERGDAVIAVLVKEEKAFRRTLRKGIKQLRAYTATASPAPNCSPSTTPSASRSSCRTEEARRAGHPGEPTAGAPSSTSKMAEQRARSQAATRARVG